MHGSNSGLRRLLAVFALAAAVVACGDSDDNAAEEDREEVRIIYVVESSWFATDPDLVRASLAAASSHMTACAENSARHCEIMMFAVQGAQVSAKRVPASLRQDSDTGYWYSLDPARHVDNRSLWNDLVAERIGAFITNVDREIVPATYEEQPQGCVNLVANFAKAFEELDRNPGDRNVVVVFATGISNCLGQSFYDSAKRFPPVDIAVESVLEDVPHQSAVVDEREAPVCIDWSPMFGEAYLEGGHYIGQGERQVLKAAWLEILEQWGAVRGNSPGEQLGDCLTMEMPSS